MAEEQVGSVFVELSLNSDKYDASMKKVEKDAKTTASTVGASLSGGMGTAITAVSTAYLAASQLINQATSLIKSAMSLSTCFGAKKFA